MPLPRLGKHLLWFATHKIGFWVFHLGWSYRCTGRRQLPDTGPALIVSNHQSFIDPLLVGLIARRPLTFLARHNLFKIPFFGALVREYGAFPIDRNLGKDGLQAVFEMLGCGEAVTVFAEGERTHNGELQSLKPGIALLVKRADAPIVPCAIIGAFESWPRHAKRPALAPLFLPKSPGSIAVAFGEALPARYYRTWHRDAILKDLGERIAQAALAAKAIQRK